MLIFKILVNLLIDLGGLCLQEKETGTVGTKCTYGKARDFRALGDTMTV